MFFHTPSPDPADLAAFSWHIEAALVLGWALHLVKALPEATAHAPEEVIEDFLARIPALGDATGSFLAGLRYRPLEEIIDENLFHELATGYFRDLHFSGIPEWDETDTST